ncbi:flagellin N-terminal helical domain-containing protein [Undibacterium terreum]|uniref:Flagellin n=1 Tax=Undibacterium terreum TaxID=1224302 RepID=A0A916XBU3_9BURK|nr:flagellin [Undibacterium terreum]GGC62025.1 flagellin [Undibacterium terreum]
MLQINTNIASLTTQRYLTRAQAGMETDVQRISSGLRINSARDDAAGLAISDRMTAQIRGQTQALRNANDGISLLQTAQGTLDKITDNFQRMRTLAVQAANGSNSRSDRDAIQSEVDQLVAANQQMANQAEFNGNKLLDGSFTGQKLQIGPNYGQTLAVNIPELFAKPLTKITLVNTPLAQASAIGNASSAIAAGNLSINGISVGASTAGAQAGQSNSSAWAIAQAITAANIPTVTATADTAISGNVSSNGVIAAGALSINGVALGAISGASGHALALSAAAAISAALGASGVDAVATAGSTINLDAADGRDIVISETVPGSAAKLGLSTGTFHGQITVSNTPSPTRPSLTIGGLSPGNAGFTPGVVAATDTGQFVLAPQAAGFGGEPAVDVTTISAASAALSYIDGKLARFDDIRADLGALENRLGSVQANLSASSLNLSAARSRIQDTDFASATASLTRNQILQQAGTAMLAQANIAGQAALRLLSA